MRPRPRSAGAMALVVLWVTIAGGCGIDADSSPRALPVTTTTTTAPTTEPRGDQEVRIYMVKSSSLVPIIRRLPTRSPREVMNSLLAPPGGSEGQGISSSIPAGTDLLGISGPDDGLVEIDLSADFDDVQGEARLLALGQIVMSETLLPGVEQLSFALDGEPLTVFSPERGDVDVVDACDYAGTLADPSAEDSDLTVQQELDVQRRREALKATC